MRITTLAAPRDLSVPCAVPSIAILATDRGIMPPSRGTATPIAISPPHRLTSPEDP